MLRPQFTPEEVHRPEYTYWNYPKAVTNYDMFEPGMVPILLNNGGIKKLVGTFSVKRSEDWRCVPRYVRS